MSAVSRSGVVRHEGGLGFAHGFPADGLGRHGGSIRCIEGAAQGQVSGASAAGPAAASRLRPFPVGDGGTGTPEWSGGAVSGGLDEAADQGGSLAAAMAFC